MLDTKRNHQTLHSIRGALGAALYQCDTQIRQKVAFPHTPEVLEVRGGGGAPRWWGGAVFLGGSSRTPGDRSCGYARAQHGAAQGHSVGLHKGRSMWQRRGVAWGYAREQCGDVPGHSMRLRRGAAWGYAQAH